MERPGLALLQKAPCRVHNPAVLMRALHAASARAHPVHACAVLAVMQCWWRVARPARTASDLSHIAVWPVHSMAKQRPHQGCTAQGL